jgi:hypothetical protein
VTLVAPRVPDGGEVQIRQNQRPAPAVRVPLHPDRQFRREQDWLLRLNVRGSSPLTRF